MRTDGLPDLEAARILCCPSPRCFGSQMLRQLRTQWPPSTIRWPPKDVRRTGLHQKAFFPHIAKSVRPMITQSRLSDQCET